MKLNADQIFYLNQLSLATGKNARDCIIGEKLIGFLVSKENLPKVIGKKGANVKKLGELFKKKVLLFEYDLDPKKVVEKAFSKTKISQIKVMENQGQKTIRVQVAPQERFSLLRDGARFRALKEILKRNYDIMDIKI